MLAILNAGWKLKIWGLNICIDTRGQDLTEYALLGGFLAAACGAVLPTIAISITTVFSKLVAILASTGFTTAPGG
ncbi:MAG TPA: hypothetical protein VME17_24110 [Bryobacteraceae bacterium]|nr:hypothetical protein [Bryobacteraceae bacterium]